jgi:hypothetical protein
MLTCSMHPTTAVSTLTLWHRPQADAAPARERLSRAKRARHDAVQQVEAANQTFAKAAQENIASSSKLVSSSTAKIASGVSISSRPTRNASHPLS